LSGHIHIIPRPIRETKRDVTKSGLATGCDLGPTGRFGAQLGDGAASDLDEARIGGRIAIDLTDQHIEPMMQSLSRFTQSAQLGEDAITRKRICHAPSYREPAVAGSGNGAAFTNV
jgi:hypothetical protein